jgi:acylphosphatase
MSNAKKQHVRCLFFGNVQGVNFRYNTYRTAQQFGVTGYVRNLVDGTVELVAEGPPKTVEDFIAAVERRMQGFIHRKQVDSSPDLAGYTAFEIRF